MNLYISHEDSYGFCEIFHQVVSFMEASCVQTELYATVVKFVRQWKP